MREKSFKPYYNWNTFNTIRDNLENWPKYLSFKPYYNWNTFNTWIIGIFNPYALFHVLNLIITGIPSILYRLTYKFSHNYSFKPYYNWNTFNTEEVERLNELEFEVLNLIITGIPSIQKRHDWWWEKIYGFKPYYNWNTFNTVSPSGECAKTGCFKPYYNWNTFNTKYMYI